MTSSQCRRSRHPRHGFDKSTTHRTNMTENMTALRVSTINFRAPTSSKGEARTDFEAPPKEFLFAKWFVNFSTLPMWKSNRNVTITYSQKEGSPDEIDDLVEYQPLSSNEDKSVHGVDKPDGKDEAAFKWRGHGMLKVASSHWDILGWGEEDGGWMAIYFKKTPFTDAGIDVMCKRKLGLTDRTIHELRKEMRNVDDPEFRRLSVNLFPIKQDRYTHRAERNSMLLKAEGAI